MKSNKMPVVALLVAGMIGGQSIVAPRQSHALVFAASGGTALPALILLGAGAAATVGGGFLFVEDPKWSNMGPGALGVTGAVTAFTGIFAILSGIILLDESGAPTPDFQPLTPAKAEAAGIAPREMRGFNRQLDRINSVSESIARGVAQKNFTDTQAALRYVHGEWQAARDNNFISNDAFAALSALSTHSYQELSAAR